MINIEKILNATMDKSSVALLHDVYIDRSNMQNPAYGSFGENSWGIKFIYDVKTGSWNEFSIGEDETPCFNAYMNGTFYITTDESYLLLIVQSEHELIEAGELYSHITDPFFHELGTPFLASLDEALDFSLCIRYRDRIYSVSIIEASKNLSKTEFELCIACVFDPFIESEKYDELNSLLERLVRMTNLIPKDNTTDHMIYWNKNWVPSISVENLFLNITLTASIKKSYSINYVSDILKHMYTAERTYKELNAYFNEPGNPKLSNIEFPGNRIHQFAHSVSLRLQEYHLLEVLKNNFKTSWKCHSKQTNKYRTFTERVGEMMEEKI